MNFRVILFYIMTVDVTNTNESAAEMFLRGRGEGEGGDCLSKQVTAHNCNNDESQTIKKSINFLLNDLFLLFLDLTTFFWISTFRK